jgi:hypothetical protein
LGLGLLLTWYLVNSVLQTPVNSIIATRNGTAALTAMMGWVELFGAHERLSDGLSAANAVNQLTSERDDDKELRDKECK